jgi:flagellar protein FlhE
MVWSQEKISNGISQAGLPASTYYSAPSRSGASAPGLGSSIVRVSVQRNYRGPAPMATQLCWSDLSLCVPMTTPMLVTDAFNGRDARGPLVLVHTLQGKGRLPQPVFVRASVSVWFIP